MTEEAAESRRGLCPNCGAPVPFRLLWKRAEPFDCVLCGHPIVLAMIGVGPVVVVAILLVLLAAGKLPVLPLLALLVVGAMLEWMTVKVSLAEPPAARGEPAEG